jgi:betaine-aldehyde dehydrogenase
VQWRFRPDGRGRGSGLHDFDEYAQIKHVMVELSGEAEQGWHYTIFGDPKAD